MKRLSAILLLLLPFLTGSCQNINNNLLTNPGFESVTDQVPDSWKQDAYISDPNHVQYSVDSERHSGRRSLKITHPQPNDSWFTQDVAVKPGRVYELSGWIKTEDVQAVQGKVGADLCIEGNIIRTEFVEGTQPWTQVRCYFKASASRTLAIVACRLGYQGTLTSGTAWFDDIEFKEVQLPPNVDITEF